MKLNLNRLTPLTIKTIHQAMNQALTESDDPTEEFELRRSIYRLEDAYIGLTGEFLTPYFSVGMADELESE